MKLLIFILLAACNTDTKQKNDTDVEQKVCELYAPCGTYTMSFETIDGDCGGMGEIQTEVRHGIIQPDKSASCRLTQVDWDEGVCITHSVFDCDDGLWNMLLDWRVIPDTDDTFSGTLHATMVRFTGWDCVGSYSFEAVRLANE